MKSSQENACLLCNAVIDPNIISPKNINNTYKISPLNFNKRSIKNVSSSRIKLSIISINGYFKLFLIPIFMKAIIPKKKDYRFIPNRLLLIIINIFCLSSIRSIL